jgi:hypothetical protein
VYTYLDLHTLKDRSVKMKATVLKLRSTAIRNNLLGQAEMARMIDTERKKVFERIYTDRLPPGIHQAFKYMLIDSMPTPLNKKRMIKFFAIPPLEYQNQRQGGITRITNAMDALESAKSQIRSLGKKLVTYMGYMRLAEINERGSILEDIRLAKGMSRADVSAIMQELFPEEPGSISTIRRNEIGERRITLDLSNKLSEALDTPIGFFKQDFFNR